MPRHVVFNPHHRHPRSTHGSLSHGGGAIQNGGSARMRAPFRQRAGNQQGRPHLRRDLRLDEQGRRQVASHAQLLQRTARPINYACVKTPPARSRNCKVGDAHTSSLPPRRDSGGLCGISARTRQNWAFGLQVALCENTVGRCRAQSAPSCQVRVKQNQTRPPLGGTTCLTLLI